MSWFLGEKASIDGWITIVRRFTSHAGTYAWRLNTQASASSR